MNSQLKFGPPFESCDNMVGGVGGGWGGVCVFEPVYDGGDSAESCFILEWSHKPSSEVFQTTNHPQSRGWEILSHGHNIWEHNCIVCQVREGLLGE